jgi:hypothetical protein
MKTSLRLITCGASALFAAALALQAQSSATSSSTTPDQQKASSTGSATVSPGSSTTGSATGGDTTWRSIQSTEQDKSATSASGSVSGSAAGSASGSVSTSSSDQPTSGASSSTSTETGTSTGIGTQANSESTIQSSVLTAQSDAEITTVVQQIDAQGPVVVERISTRFIDTACNEENARALVTALHTGGSVTLKGEDGKTATFNVSQKLGYGDAFIALSLAEEALRQAGISGCATPEQWQAVLVGGELKGGTVVSSTTTTTERFPGVLVLREQHGGWGQVAQTTNVQLGTVVANAHTSLNIEAPTSNLPPRSGYGDEADKNSQASPRGQEKGQMKGYDADKEKEKNRSDSVTPSSSGSDTEDPEGKKDAQGQPDQPPRGF